MILTSSSDHRCNSCITSAGSGGFVRFFRSKHAWFALFQFKWLGQLLVATFDKGVFGLRPMWASNGEISVTLCGVIINVLIISATADASWYGVFVLSIFMTASLRFIVCIILFTTPIAVGSSTGANNSFILFVLQNS